MFNLSIFAERLDDLMFEKGENGIQLAEAIGVKKATVYRYLRQERIPNLDIFVRIADHFHCSLSFLIGMEDEIYSSDFLSCPLFSQQFQFLLKKFKVKKSQLVEDAHFPESILYSWQSGQSVPTIESIIKLANFFKCSVDYVIGRER